MKAKVLFNAHTNCKALEDDLNEWLEKFKDGVEIEGEYKVGDYQWVIFYTPIKKPVKSRHDTSGIKEEDKPACPNCSIKMIVRNNKDGDLFWGCSKFPDCKGTRIFSDKDWALIQGGKDAGKPKRDDIPF